MNYQVKIWIQNGQGDTEEVDIISRASLSGAKSKATRWISKNYFESDIASLNKATFETSRRTDWTLRLKNPWH